MRHVAIVDMPPRQPRGSCGARGRPALARGSSGARRGRATSCASTSTRARDWSGRGHEPGPRRLPREASSPSHFEAVDTRAGVASLLEAKLRTGGPHEIGARVGLGDHGTLSTPPKKPNADDRFGVRSTTRRRTSQAAPCAAQDRPTSAGACRSVDARRARAVRPASRTRARLRELHDGAVRLARWQERLLPVRIRRGRRPRVGTRQRRTRSSVAARSGTLNVRWCGPAWWRPTKRARKSLCSVAHGSSNSTVMPSPSASPTQTCIGPEPGAVTAEDDRAAERADERSERGDVSVVASAT